MDTNRSPDKRQSPLSSDNISALESRYSAIVEQRVEIAERLFGKRNGAKPGYFPGEHMSMLEEKRNGLVWKSRLRISFVVLIVSNLLLLITSQYIDIPPGTHYLTVFSFFPFAMYVYLRAKYETLVDKAKPVQEDLEKARKDQRADKEKREQVEAAENRRRQDAENRRRQEEQRSKDNERRQQEATRKAEIDARTRLNVRLNELNKRSQTFFGQLQELISDTKKNLSVVEQAMIQGTVVGIWKAVFQTEQNLRSCFGIISSIEQNAAEHRDAVRDAPKLKGFPDDFPAFSVSLQDLPDMQSLVDRFTSVVGKTQVFLGDLAFKQWNDEKWQWWVPSAKLAGVCRVGRLSDAARERGPLNPNKLTEFGFESPLIIHVPVGAPLVIQMDARYRLTAIGAVQSLAARLLAIFTPGKLRFTFIDPVGLGQNVAAFMPLGDYDESLITSRAWSEPEHIDKRLKELTEHVENVIQKYLRHEFQTIEDYNRQAHEVAEPYRVLVVFDFPVNFTEAAARRLVSLVQNGPRCGVYPIILQDTSKQLPYGFSIQDLLQTTSVVQSKDGGFVWAEQPEDTFTLELDPPCPTELLSRIIKEVGEAAKENMTVVVPYAKVLTLAGLDPEHPEGWWQAGGAADGDEQSSAASVEIPLGPSGARKAQLLTLGKGTAHHALIAGRTGSGKSNLLHVIITTLALKYSPREIELYLIDFKKGVEFKSYANHALPHARVIAIESEREFGLSVLRGLDAEMQRRGETFRSVAANDLAEYRAKTNTQLPRLILIVDEFQEFFSEDDATGRQAATILDRLVRQGRSFGIHLLLGSQSLAGSYTLARSTLDQMQIRIALPCSEADSRLILADDNPAARLLSRPGEAIYNASSGLVEGNQVFQVALFSDQDREHYLQAIADKGAGEQRHPIVFEGHEPAEIESCEPLAQLLAAPDWPAAGKATEVWIGEPVAMTAPTSVRFRRQGGANLLIVTREEEEGVGLLSTCVLGLAVQHRPEAAKLYILDLATADAPWSELAGELADLLPHRIEVLGRRDIPGLLADLTAEIQRRSDDTASARAWNGYLIIQGLHRARDLRSDPAQGYSFGEEEPKASPAEQFATILREGPEVGIHTLVWCDTYLNLDRTLDTRALREFGYRVAGTMTQDDSTRLLDDAAASRLDRPHRMIKYDEDQVGVLEKFRPYRIPATTWLERTAEALRGR